MLQPHLGTNKPLDEVSSDLEGIATQMEADASEL